MTSRYGKYSITGNAVNSWNKIQKTLKNTLLKDLSPITLNQLSAFIFFNHINNFFSS